MNKLGMISFCFLILAVFLSGAGCSRNLDKENDMFSINKLIDDRKADVIGNAAARFVPADGKIFSGAGQSIEAIAEMTHSADENHKPVIAALYDYMTSPAVYLTGADILEAPALFPGAILQIGLVLPNQDVNELIKLGNGDYDDTIETAARTYRDIRLPILLRVGVEFDAPWNPGCQPEPFIRGYRRIVDVFRANKADNVAFAWNSYTCGDREMFRWYPDNPDTGEKDGDKYVDWFSFNVFTDSFDASWYMEQARLHKKPVFIGEGGYGHTDQLSTFGEWTGTFFNSIKKYGIKGYQYINWDWRVYPLWSSFKNARFTGDKQKEDLYNSHLSNSEFLFRDDSYYDPIALFIDCARAMPDSENEGAAWSKEWDHYTCKNGYDYSVEGATVSNGDNWWSKGWVSEGDSVKVTLKIPNGNEGNLIFSVNPVTGYIVKAGGIMTVTVGKQKPVNITEGYGFVKLPVLKSDTSEGMLEITIKGNTGKVLINNLGFLDFSKNSPDRPKLYPAASDIKQKVELKWAGVRGAFIYNIYRDYKLIGRTGGENFTDESAPDAGNSIYSVTAVNERSGEGPMSIAVK